MGFGLPAAIGAKVGAPNKTVVDIDGDASFSMTAMELATASQFDIGVKVIVLNKGRQVYAGPPSEARAYFESLGYKSLPRQSTPDYLTGCTDPNERQFAPGRSEDDVPTTPEQMEEAFLRSRFAGDMLDQLQKYKHQMESDKSEQETFRKAVLADKKKGVSKKSPYTLGFTGQVKALFIRQFRMRLQDRFQLITSFSLSWVSGYA